MFKNKTAKPFLHYCFFIECINLKDCLPRFKKKIVFISLSHINHNVLISKFAVTVL